MDFLLSKTSAKKKAILIFKVYYDKYTKKPSKLVLF